MTQRMTSDRIPSPLGDIIVVAQGESLCAADFADYESRTLELLRIRLGDVELEQAAVSPAIRRGFEQYFEGDFEAITKIPLVTEGTAFQERVWAALRRTKPGERLAYSELASNIGQPRAVRAVGLANGRNPISIAIPCHRIVGKDGSLTGYAGGLDRKAWLLAHEDQFSKLTRDSRRAGSGP